MSQFPTMACCMSQFTTTACCMNDAIHYHGMPNSI
jgi:hypothetical protein